ncbi:MAG: FAD-dependent oxidoreductase [Bacteriovoracaceae bacterium]|nr:FAD-dependent oxidoreductase [Bacteriovoracaceae bacterium]
MKKLAIIGTGIAGMSAAYFLRDEFEVTLFEKNNYVGGHTNTIEVHDGEKTCPMDTGFMVFNEETYPNLLKLFAELKVPYKDTDMSFSVRNDEIDLEYNGSSLNGLFAQRKNIFNFKFIKMIREILKFNGDAPNVLNNPDYADMTIRDYIKKLGLSDYFFKNFLVAMSSAVWSTPIEKMGEFPAKSLIRFFQNHGFVGVDTQLQWKTVIGGSREYRNRIVSKLGDRFHISCPVTAITQFSDKVEVTTSNEVHTFDKVIVCTHADEALALLKTPSALQKEVLSKFSYQKNEAVVHTDASVMPELKSNWSSWNFMMKEQQAYTVYYMNRLQGVSEKKDFFVNINGENFVDENKVIQKITYHHPVFTLESSNAQTKIDQLNSNTNLHFSGSYYRYGFHEDALLSSVELCKSILGREVFK